MPPTFAYMLALMLWLFIACLVWVGALIMALFPRRRPVARAIALGMAGTFPGVVLYQIMAVPIVGVFSLAAYLCGKILDSHSATTENPIVIAIAIIWALGAFSVIALMSLVGFCEGWRVGWAYSKCCSLRNAIRMSLTGTLLLTLRRPPRRF